MRQIRVLLVEDHHLVREGLRLLLEEQGDFEVVGQAANGTEALQLIDSLRPDVVVMDISMPNLNGLETTARLSAMPRPPRVIILSQHKRHEYVVQALRAGANGYLLKDAVVNELSKAIHEVFEGRSYLSTELPLDVIEEYLRQQPDSSPLDLLTPREREVLQLVAEGNTNRQIAAHLSISVKTVEKHRFNLMEKLDIHDVTGLVRFAMLHGIIKSDET
ncbi:MAG: response regulator transcription factor [Anaerolineae bacterium]